MMSKLRSRLPVFILIAAIGIFLLYKSPAWIVVFLIMAGYYQYLFIRNAMKPREYNTNLIISVLLIATGYSLLISGVETPGFLELVIRQTRISLPLALILLGIVHYLICYIGSGRKQRTFNDFAAIGFVLLYCGVFTSTLGFLGIFALPVTILGFLVISNAIVRFGLDSEKPYIRFRRLMLCFAILGTLIGWASNI